MLLYRSSGASPGCRRIEVIHDIEFSVAGTVTGADDGIYGGSWGVYTCANQLNFVACDIVGPIRDSVGGSDAQICDTRIDDRGQSHILWSRF